MISFAGDALICIFPVNLVNLKEDEIATSVNEVCQRAVQCAMVLTNTPSSELTLHVAVSYGMVRFATIGGYENQWIYLMNGSCTAELSSCKELYGLYCSMFSSTINHYYHV